MPELSEERIAHLGMIQNVITRMASESARMKQFALAAVGVLASTSEATDSSALALIGTVLAVVFWMLDARYLQQERWYRALFDSVRVQDGPSAFLMTPEPQMRSGSSLLSAATGWTTAPVYGVLVVVTLALALIVWVPVTMP